MLDLEVPLREEREKERALTFMECLLYAVNSASHTAPLTSSNPHNRLERQIAKEYSVRMGTQVYLTSKSLLFSFHQGRTERFQGSGLGITGSRK